MSNNIKIPTINYTIFLSNHTEVSTLYFPSKKLQKFFNSWNFFYLVYQSLSTVKVNVSLDHPFYDVSRSDLDQLDLLQHLEEHL